MTKEYTVKSLFFFILLLSFAYLSGQVEKDYYVFFDSSKPKETKTYSKFWKKITFKKNNQTFTFKTKKNNKIKLTNKQLSQINFLSVEDIINLKKKILKNREKENLIREDLFFYKRIFLVEKSNNSFFLYKVNWIIDVIKPPPIRDIECIF